MRMASQNSTVALAASSTNGATKIAARGAVAGSPLRLAALLIGVNLAPLVTPWGSLATLLWAERLRSLGITIRWVPFAVAGLLVTAVVLPAAVVVLWVLGAGA